MGTHRDGHIDLVLVGHFGLAEDRTPFGHAVSLGGSGYACAVGARAGDPGRTGIVANIGEDFATGSLDRLGVDKTGATFLSGSAPRLTITQFASGNRSFASNLGVAAFPQKGRFPEAYRKARHIHLATMPPSEQAHWLRVVRSKGGSRVSVDMFERTAMDLPEESRALCYSADLVFMNQREREILFDDHPLPQCDLLLKRGADGAAYRSSGNWLHAGAARCPEVDTTGAGEVLAGAFLSLRALGVSISCALRLAVAVASAKVTEFGVDGPNLRSALDRVHAAATARLVRGLRT
jgi:ribokinase